MMIENGYLYCDQCGKPIRLVSGMQFFFDGEQHYCVTCAAGVPPETQPRLGIVGILIRRIIRWFS
ncbi:MAG TPA: hypothetical protein VGF82_08110 [Terracidiphilus sp.]|jgi:hypothetical protein